MITLPQGPKCSSGSRCEPKWRKNCFISCTMSFINSYMISPRTPWVLVRAPRLLPSWHVICFICHMSHSLTWSIQSEFYLPSFMSSHCCRCSRHYLSSCFGVSAREIRGPREGENQYHWDEWIAFPLVIKRLFYSWSLLSIGARSPALLWIYTLAGCVYVFFPLYVQITLQSSEDRWGFNVLSQGLRKWERDRLRFSHKCIGTGSYQVGANNRLHDIPRYFIFHTYRRESS